LNIGLLIIFILSSAKLVLFTWAGGVVLQGMETNKIGAEGILVILCCIGGLYAYNLMLPLALIPLGIQLSIWFISFSAGYLLDWKKWDDRETPFLSIPPLRN
jgi:hypothetical protein